MLGEAIIDNEETNVETNECDGVQGVERKDSPFAKERRQLLQLVQSLQENHDKEIDLMESSYRYVLINTIWKKIS